MTEPTLDSKLRNRITRFIHTGVEVPKYYPGCWSSHKYFEVDKCKAIDDAFAVAQSNGLEVVKIILQAAKDGWYTRFETIAFSLAKCLLFGSDNVKEAVYKGVLEVCKTPEQMMLFNKHTRILKTGNGQGWCRSVREWYTQKEPMELAKEVSRVRARHGRSHKTLIRKSHLKVASDDYARDAIIKYSIYGLKRAKQLVGDKAETKAVFELIQKVEDMRHCEDPVAAAAIATQNQFTLDHVPGHLLTAQEVWDAVLPQMSLRDILFNIQRIHNMGFLTSDSTTTAVLISLLNNQEVINKSEVTPIEVFITLNNYKNKSKPLKAEKAKIMTVKEERRRSRQIFDPKTGLWEWSSTKRHPKEIKNWGIEKPPNQAVIASLNKLIDQSWLAARPTNVRYLITMDMRHHMFKGRHFCKRYAVPKKGKKAATSANNVIAANNNTTPSAGGDADAKKESKKHLHAECFYNKAVTPGHAAIILALQLLKREKQVKLAVFTEEGIQLVTLERNFTNIEEAEFQLRKMNLGRVQLDAPIEWASKTKEKVDVFINMIDRSTRYMELDHESRGGRGNGARFGPPPAGPEVPDRCPVRAVERYRDSSGVRDAKLIVLNLASHRVATTDGSHEGVLDVVGIDEHVPKLMDAFALGHFA